MRSKTQKTVFWIIMPVMTWLCVEAFSLIAYAVINHTAFSYPKARSKLEDQLSSDSPELKVTGRTDLKWGDFVEVLHPYFGFVADPYQNKPMWKVSDFGFLMSGNVNPIVKKSPDKVIVGCFGGSLGGVIYPYLKEVLEQHSTDIGKQFVVINFAAGGYKQPQQLMILNYLLALGAEFDFVINLDGFNDIVLAPTENAPNHVNPFFPRGWDRRTANIISPATVRLVGLVEVTKRSREKWAYTFRKHHLYLSPTLFLLWQSQDQRRARTIYDANQNIKTESAKSQTFTMKGPPYSYSDETLLYNDLAQVWKRCSVQMKTLCDANGAHYYHFLQPNQYVPGSKPMTEEERKIAINKDSPYTKEVEKGYPLMIKQGAILPTLGVKFTDLTSIFADNREILYIDDCCHTNSKGSVVIAQRIYQTILPELNSR
jgi:hypothetical protein